MVGENVVFINYVKSAVLSDTHTNANLILAQEPQRSEPLCTLISGPPLSVPLAFPRICCSPRARAFRGPFRRRIADCVVESVNQNRLTYTIFTQYSDAGRSVLFITI